MLQDTPSWTHVAGQKQVSKGQLDQYAPNYNHTCIWVGELDGNKLSELVS